MRNRSRMERAFGIRQLVSGIVLAGVVAFGLLAQAGAHLLGLTSTPDVTAADERDSGVGLPGDFPVGIGTLTDDLGGSTIWYPAIADDEPSVTYAYGLKVLGPNVVTALATWDGTAREGAAFDLSTGPHPLVVLSPGFAISARSYGWLAEHLASHGMVVVSTEHPENLNPGRLWISAIERPERLRELLNGIARRTRPDGEFAGLIDTSRVAVIGHSFGGYTALAVGGATLDMPSFGRSCAVARATDDPLTFLCNALEPHAAEISADAPFVRAAIDVDAVVSMAGDAAMFGASGLGDLTVPVMAIGGTADVDTPFAWGTQYTFDHVGSARRIEVALEGAEHLVFSGRCDGVRRLTTVVPLGFCSDTAWDRDEAQAVVRTYVTAFLLTELTGTDSIATLTGSHEPNPSVDVRVEGY